MSRAYRFIQLALGLTLLVAACSAPAAEKAQVNPPRVETPTLSPGVAEVEETATEDAPVATTAARPSAAPPETATPAQRPTRATATSSPAATETVATEMPPAPPATEGSAEGPQSPAPSSPAAPATQPGPSSEQQQLLVGLQNHGPAPELRNEAWLNSDPLKLADLQGKVVLLEFWTFG